MHADEGYGRPPLQYTLPKTVVQILDTWLNTPFKSTCFTNDDKPWPHEISSFLNNSLIKMSKIEKDKAIDTRAVCCLVDEDSEGTLTLAFARFKAVSVDLAHHHMFEHDFVMIKGKKSVWNLTKEERYDLEEPNIVRH
ncbi:DNA-damage-repair/toleration protein DRT102 [Spatholobus suberectus]|nr:DNA-damage-repair/toleration protein DRT102 [Spatholobus suberectus]